MTFVVDANIILSALISDSTTRRLLVDLDDDLLTPAYIHDEIENYTDMVSEKAGLTPVEVEDLVEILFKRIEVVSRSEVLNSSRRPPESCGMSTMTTRSTSLLLSSATPKSGATTGTTTNRLPLRSRPPEISSTGSNGRHPGSDRPP